jgi:hypothetical protein
MYTYLWDGNVCKLVNYVNKTSVVPVSWRVGKVYSYKAAKVKKKIKMGGWVIVLPNPK